MTAMRRVTMLVSESLWSEMAIAASVRAQTRGEYVRTILTRETDGVLWMAGMKKDPEKDAELARQEAERQKERDSEVPEEKE